MAQHNWRWSAPSSLLFFSGSSPSSEKMVTTNPISRLLHPRLSLSRSRLSSPAAISSYFSSSPAEPSPASLGLTKLSSSLTVSIGDHHLHHFFFSLRRHHLSCLSQSPSPSLPAAAFLLLDRQLHHSFCSCYWCCCLREWPMKMLSSSFSTGPAFQHHFLLFTSGHQQHQHLLFSSGSPSTSALHRQHHWSPPLLHLLWLVSSVRWCCHPCCCFLLSPAAPETAAGHRKALLF